MNRLLALTILMAVALWGGACSNLLGGGVGTIVVSFESNANRIDEGSQLEYMGEEVGVVTDVDLEGGKKVVTIRLNEDGMEHINGSSEFYIPWSSGLLMNARHMRVRTPGSGPALRANHQFTGFNSLPAWLMAELNRSASSAFADAQAGLEGLMENASDATSEAAVNVQAHIDEFNAYVQQAGSEVTEEKVRAYLGEIEAAARDLGNSPQAERFKAAIREKVEEIRSGLE